MQAAMKSARASGGPDVRGWRQRRCGMSSEATAIPFAVWPQGRSRSILDAMRALRSDGWSIPFSVRLAIYAVAAVICFVVCLLLGASRFAALASVVCGYFVLGIADRVWVRRHRAEQQQSTGTM